MQLHGDLVHRALHSDGQSCALMTATAALPACRVFERRLWCRFLCPIGGMNGMFAKLAMTEVRASRGVCAGVCAVLLSQWPWSCHS